MRKTKVTETDNHLLVDTVELQKMLCCGRASAVKIGTDAESVVRVGRRVLYNTQKIQRYIDAISE